MGIGKPWAYKKAFILGKGGGGELVRDVITYVIMIKVLAIMSIYLLVALF